ncbi:SipW-dependent-type signal peptide-containing protein [Haloglomus litoreum]|uniref:SipW-dependent-type signal peptide-containing protein n=1 Tax=Haloglomus litoreum TaxID=3034026 RepID=UPI0023E75942|nr:vWA domain-containing protein [Haloglomus sp. DT116]
MSDRRMNITRRKVLAAVGAVGAAGAGAGLGTSALFNDTESFEGNSITAGELDLLVDWQQTYDGAGDPVYVNAHPDHDGDGRQSVLHPTEPYAVEYTEANLVDFLTCDTPGFDDDYDFDGNETQDSLVELSDVKPGDTGEITFSLHLCDNPGYIWMQAANVDEDDGAHPEPEPGTPVPSESGDDGVDGGQLAENIQVEMWYDDDCNNVPGDGRTADIMLTLDFSGSMLYNQYGGVVSNDSITINGSTYSETTKIDLVEKGTRQFVDFLDDTGADAQVGVAYFDGSTDDIPRVGILQGLTSDLNDVEAALTGLRKKLANVVTADPSPTVDDGNPDPYASVSIAEGTYIGEGVNLAQEELDDNGRSGVEYDNIVLSDGNAFEGTDGNEFITPSDAADDAKADLTENPPTDLYAIAVDTGANGVNTLQGMAGPGAGSTSDPPYFFDVDDPLDIPTVFSTLANVLAPEQVFFDGTLAQALAELTDGDGIALDADPVSEFIEVGDEGTLDDEDPDNAASRECFVAEESYCLGFRWELPASVGNVVQGDSVEFDLGFYTQQCRNNDGTGPNPD